MRVPDVAFIHPDRAKPLVDAFCARMGLPSSEGQDGFWDDSVLWLGLGFDGRIYAVLGLQYMDEATTHVWGAFGDGSQSVKERIAAAYVLKVLRHLNNEYCLTATVLEKNEPSKKHLRKMGWEYVGSHSPSWESWRKVA